MSNRLSHIFEVTDREWNAERLDTDEFLSASGRVMDGMLSEHMCEGWLEGYLLTGRHGFFASYEAFIRIIDSMAAQHAKWLKVCNGCRGVSRSRRSTRSSLPTYGSRTTTALPIRTRVS